MTVLIACKNRTKNLKYCLASVNNSVRVPQTLVVDFGSDTVLSNVIRYPWLSIVRTTRDTKMFHKARALNIGIRRIKTKYLCITDADQIFSPDFFSVVYAVLSKGKKAFIMCKTYFLRAIPEDVVPDNLGKNYKRLLQLAKNSGLKQHGDGCCNGVSTKWAQAVNGYDEAYRGYGGEDSDFALRAKFAGFRRVEISKRVSMVHLPHVKDGKYYNKNVFKKNKRRYYEKERTKEIVANKEIEWGKL